jgi:KTSC domain
MPVRTFNAGRLRKADYDPASQQLDLHFDNGNVLAYKHVPQEVFRRLCSAPNAATYWEDRIAEEYPKGTPRSGASQGGGGKSLGDLFGGDEPAQ